MALKRKRFGLRTEEWVALFVIIGIAGIIALFALPNFVSPPHRRTGPKNWCINNLRQIDGAKEQWALENNRSTNDPAIESEIIRYIKGSRPACPEGGTYTFGKVGEPPRCSIPGHVL